MAMCMTDDEILTNWRNAGNKKAQVRVLAELNNVSMAEMRETLERLGCKPISAKSGEKRNTNKLDDKKALELYLDGASDKEAAAALGVATVTFRDWRKAQRLPINPSCAKRGRTVPPDEVPESGGESTGEKPDEPLTAAALATLLAEVAEKHPGAVVCLAEGENVRSVEVRFDLFGAKNPGSAVVTVA